MNIAKKTFQPTGRTLRESIENCARLYPDNGFTFMAMNGSEDWFSFTEIEPETRRRAKALQDQGLQKGDRVGLIIIEPKDFVLTFLAATRVGIVPVPLYPPMSMGELDAYIARLTRILTTAGAKLVVASEKLKNLLWGVVNEVPSLTGLVPAEGLDAEGDPELPEIDPDDLCFLQYTSGSTSDPKGVMVTHANLVANVMAIMTHFDMDPNEDTSLAWLPLYHDMGLIGFVMSTVIFGKKCVLIPTLRFLKKPSVWMDAVHRHRATITFCPPFALPLAARRAKPAELAEWDLSSLHTVGVGAEPIHAEGCAQFTELLASQCGLPRTAVTSAYGMAEATLAITLGERGDALASRRIGASLFQDEGVSRPAEGVEETLVHVSCGIPFPGHDIRILEPETGREMADGCEGEICLQGPSVTGGYFCNAEATAEAFRGGWLHTGDLGYMHEGELYVTGRLKDLIILNGRNIHPQSLEWVVQELDGVRKGNVVAFSVPGANTEDLVIALETRGEAPEGLDAAVRDALSSAYAVPVKEVVILPAGRLPKTSSGKLQRRGTRNMYLSGTLGLQGSRQQGGSANKVALAKHVAKSVWTRVKYKVL